jgi:opacity protein-like surface antigen
MLVVPVVGQTRVGKLGLGVDGSMQYILGAGSVKASPGIGGGVNMSLSLMEGISLRSKFSINQLAWENTQKKSITTDMMSLNGYLSADFMPNSSFNMFPFVGGGLVFYDPKDSTGGRPAKSVSSFDIQFGGGLGLEYFPNEFWSITLLPEYVMTNSQYYNGPANKDNDSYFRVSLQFRYYFFDESFITNLLEAHRARLKPKR